MYHVYTFQPDTGSYIGELRTELIATLESAEEQTSTVTGGTSGAEHEASRAIKRQGVNART